MSSPGSPTGTGNPHLPLDATCSKYEQQRQALTASVIIANDHDFMAGRLKIGVNLTAARPSTSRSRDGPATFARRCSRRDRREFQSTVLDMRTSDLVLAFRLTAKVPPRNWTTTSPRSVASDRGPAATISHARYLSEFLLTGICQQQIHQRHYSGRNPVGEALGVNSTEWHLRLNIKLSAGEAADKTSSRQHGQFSSSFSYSSSWTDITEGASFHEAQRATSLDDPRIPSLIPPDRSRHVVLKIPIFEYPCGRWIRLTVARVLLVTIGRDGGIR